MKLLSKQKINMSSTVPYSIVKMGLLDVSSYVHCGVELDDVEETLNNVIDKTKGCSISPVYGMLCYKIYTPYDSDEKIKSFLNDLVAKLDALAVDRLVPDKKLKLQ